MLVLMGARVSGMRASLHIFDVSLFFFFFFLLFLFFSFFVSFYFVLFLQGELGM